MLTKKSRHSWYIFVLVVFSLIITSVMANTKVYKFFDVTSFALINSISTTVKTTTVTKNKTLVEEIVGSSAEVPFYFATIISNADEEVFCTNDGATLARFNLCGNFDNRVITLGQSYSTYEWQQLTTGTCSLFDVDLNCPTYTCGGLWTTVSTSSTFALNANSISAATGAEFRVRVNGGSYYYIKVKKSTISQTYVKRDYICGVPGRVQVTNLSSSYEYAIDGGSGFGAWQGAIFDGLLPDTYIVKARLKNTPNTCEYPYEPIVIESKEIDIDVTVVDAQCFGENGSISVQVNDVPGPYKYTLLDSNGFPQEFTSFIASSTYNFAAVGFGTYSVQVETQQCKGDPGNGIAAPRQDVDTTGNPIIIGDGLIALAASTEVNSSFGCSDITSVDIIVRTSGGSAPYTFTVNGNPTVSSSYTGQTIYTVSASGDYNFLITDGNGCTITASANVKELSPPVVSASGVNGTCTNGGAKINFNVSNARGYNLSYRIQTSDPWVTTPQISVADGTYNSLEVRYQQGSFSCTMILPPVTVTSVGGLTGTASLNQDYTCANGGGIINFSPAGGGSGSGYQFSIDNVNYQIGTSFTGLAPGTYTPYIKDDGGCFQGLTPIVVNEPEQPSAIDFVQDNIDCSTGTSRVTINVTSGVAITQYAIISPSLLNQTSNIFSGLNLDTSYQFEITDANGCVYPASFTTGGISTIRARVKSGGDRKVCILATDGYGAFLVDGFSTDYSYTISGTPISGTGNDLEIPATNLSAGTYTLTVTDNITNCTSTADLVISEATTPLSIVANETAMSCQNNNVGRVQGAAIGGFGGYKYQLDGPPGFVTQGPRTNRTFGNLTIEGNYTLTVIDSEGCTATDTFTLTAVSAPTIAQDATDYCYSALNGASITVTSAIGSAAIGTHQYRINAGTLQTTATPGTFTFTNLVPGNYTLEVVDGNNCSASIQVRIPPQAIVNLDIIDEIPCGGDGELEIEVSGGSISNLSATSYTIYKDGVAVTGHTGNVIPSNPFSYTVPFGEHGIYTVEVTDNNGCTNISSAITFVEPTNILATHRIVDPSCSDPNSGFVEIMPTVSSGIPPFQVVFAPVGSLQADPNDPDPNVVNTYNFTSQTIYSGLAAGDYEYIVKDANNCITTIIPITVTADTTLPPATTITPIGAFCSFTRVSGGVTINSITDGVPEYTIIIEDVFGTQLFIQQNITAADLPLTINDDDLVVGEYRVITLDSRGCIDEDALTIISSEVIIVPDPVVPAVCDANGFTYCVDIVNGIGPFEIRRVTDPVSAFIPLGATATPRNYCFPNIQFGESFTVEVFDTTTGCYYTQIIEVPTGSSTIDVALNATDGTCDPSGLIQYDLNYVITGYVGPNFNITVTNLDTGAVLESLVSTTNVNGTFANYSPGNYGIVVVDSDGCADGDAITIFTNSPRVDIISNLNANCNEDGQLTVRGSGGAGGPYVYAFVPSSTIPSAGDFSDVTTVSLPGAIGAGITYDIWVRDSRNCEYKTSAAIVQLDEDLPAPDINVDNQCNVTTPVGGFTVTIEMPGNIDTPTFTLNGISQTPTYISGTPTQAVFNVSGIGSYPVHVIDINGCFVDGIAEVYQVLSAFGEFTTIPTCEDANGEITVTADGGSGDFEFLLTGTDFQSNSVSTTQINNGVFTNIAPGTYEVLVTDNQVKGGIPPAPCTYLVENIISAAPVTPIIADTGENNISCNGLADGSINAVLVANTDTDGIKEFNLYIGSMPLAASATPIATNTSGSFVSLAPNTYVIEVVTDKNCFDQVEVEIIDPPVFSINASAPQFVCETGANRYSTTTITANVVGIGNGGPYGYKINAIDSYQTGINTFEIVDSGVQQTIYVYAIDSNGCEFTIPTPIVLDPPNNVSAVITQNSAMNCEDAESITVTVTGTTNFVIEDQGSSVVLVPSVPQTSGSSVTFDLPMQAGEYRLQVYDAGGCLYPIEPYIISEPIQPIVTISEAKPVSCFGSDDGALNISIADYIGGDYSYEVYYSDNPGFTGGSFGTPIASGTLNIITNPDVISNLPGGNLRVVVKEQGNPKCGAYSNVANIRTPNGPLTVPSVEIDNVSCDDSSGKIVATGIGGWDSSPYDYRLLLEDTTGTIIIGSVSYSEAVAYGLSNEFEGLSSGNYRVEIRDIQSCENYFEINLAPIDPIIAGIREPQGLVCPDGNNAILEAYDPTTGDSVTASPGASGGVLGSGYKYQLLYLNSNDNTDVNSRSGLQDTPTFDGVSSGFISAGWYAIEVSSSHKCIGITVPYYVVPPPPIDPKLVQVRAPGCGGQGQMRLSIENPESGFSYEYRSSTAPATDPFIPIPGTSVLIDGDQGFYQYDVRKVGGAGACASLPSEGITLVDAQAIELVANLPDDISCATENDGRIESFSSGGVGNEMYTLYLGNPTPASSTYTAFNPDPSAIVVRVPQDDGTFEGLQEGTYYIGVTSGITCGDVEGPLVITRPEVIVYTITTTNITCNGETDGSITIEVLSGGEGLVQFAINPNYNEFFSDSDNPGVYTFDNLAAGTNYEILIQDEQGCGELVPVISITEPDLLSISEVITQPEICLNAYDGEAQLTITGGTPFVDPVTFATYYETRVEGPGYPVTDSSDPTEGYLRNDNLLFSNLQGGESYRIFIRDVNGCSDDRTINVGLGVNLESVAIPQYGCEGIFPNSTVTVEMIDDSLLPELLFNLDIQDINTASATRTFGDLPPGDHIVYIYHSNGCMDQVTFTIEEYMPLSLVVTKTGPDEITALAEGGYGNYLYSFQGLSPASTNTFNLTMDANVVVQVTDEKGCIAMVTLPFDFDSMVEFPNFFTPNGDVMGDTWAPKNSQYFPFIEVKIYDRYGRVVAVLDQIRSWDGTYEGDELPTGDYWYVVHANDKDKQQYVGHFTLYR